MNRTVAVRLLAISALAFTIAGCSTNKTKEDPFESGAYKTATANPNARFKDNAPGLFDDVFGDKKTQKKLDEQQKQIAELKQEIQRQAIEKENQGSAPPVRRAAAPAPTPGETRYAVSVYFPPATANSPLSTQFQSVLGAVGANYPLQYIPSEKIADQLAASHCDLSAPAACADKLAIYPGARVIAVVDGLGTGAKGDQLTADVHLVDTLTGTTTKTRHIKLPALDGNVADRAWESLADNILMSALDEAHTAPWVAHAFSRNKNQWYLNAGSGQGLQTGDLLTVHAPGTVVRTGSGLSAGWVPGEVKGTLKVTSVVSPSLAVATVVDGSAPSPGDPLLRASKAPSKGAGASDAKADTQPATAPDGSPRK